MQSNATCKTCGIPLGKPNRSGYCRAHFARALHDDPIAAEIKRQRFQETFAKSDKRDAEAARLAALSRARLAWCPQQYLGLYRRLTRIDGYRAAEARAIIVAHVARDHCRSLVRPNLRRAA